MRGFNLPTDNLTAGMTGDDRYYMKQMKDILEAFPNKGPPFFPVQLCSHLYIGNQRNADDYEDLQRLGITHVLNCAGTRRFDLSRSPYPASSGIKGYLMIPAEDHDQYDIMQHFHDAIAFIDKCKQMGGKAFVHCNLGVNRSGAICGAYLMVYEHKPLLEIISLLKNKRQFILCNKNFRRQLMRFARCKGLLDPVIDTNCEPVNKSKYTDKVSKNNERGNYTTNSLDRATRNGKRDDTNGKADDYNSLPRRSRSNYTSSENYKNSSHTRYDSYGQGSIASGNSFLLESVPEKKPISDFVPSRSKYDSAQSNGAPTSASAPSTPKTVTFRRPTVSDVSKSTQRVRSSPSASPKLGFLSRIGTRIKRQGSLSNISRSSLDDDEDKLPKRSALKTSSKESIPDEIDLNAISTTRPLRIYKRSSTDTELYRKPSSLQTYRRAETIASADTELERPSSAQGLSREDPLLPQEYLYHTRGATHARSSSFSKSSSMSVNLLARLKPVSKSKSGSRSSLPS